MRHGSEVCRAKEHKKRRERIENKKKQEQCLNKCKKKRKTADKNKTKKGMGFVLFP